MKTILSLPKAVCNKTKLCRLLGFVESTDTIIQEGVS